MTRDPDHGPVLAVGRGGVAVEQLGARSPCRPAERRRALRSCARRASSRRSTRSPTRSSPSRASRSTAVEVEEIDVNPLLILGGSATAVDALVILASKGAG